jgi:hypothetical protein
MCAKNAGGVAVGVVGFWGVVCMLDGYNLA